MPIINIQPGQAGLAGVLPSISYIDTTDTIAEITTPGYLNKEVANGIQFSLPGIAAVSTVASPGAQPQVGWYQISHVAGNWSLSIDSSDINSLPNGQIYVGNVSGVATPVAMSGDIHITNAGVTSIQPGVIVNSEINASAAIAYSKLAALPSADILLGNASNVATATAVTGDVTISNTGVTAITAGVIVNADINAAAAIDYSKLAPLASADILVGSAGNVATAVAMTGDIGISNTGVTAIAAGIIDNADINAAAAIDFSKLAALPSAEILVGSAGNVPTATAVTGDVTIGNTGVTAIGAGKVLLAMLGAGIAPESVIKFASQYTTVGGSPAEAITVTGALATDLAFVQLVNAGSNTVSVLHAVVTSNTLTVTFSADPGNDAVINYQLTRAAS